jgi:hypothetical protein
VVGWGGEETSNEGERWNDSRGNGGENAPLGEL